MRLIYRCAACGAQNEVTRNFVTLPTALDAFAEVHRNAPVPFALIVRHPCNEETHGIANLVAIAEQ